MKRLLFSIFALSATGVYAQNIDLKINNLRLFGDYKTAEEIFAALGERPTKIRTPQPTDEEDNVYIFYFNDDRIDWVDGMIDGVRLNSNKFIFNRLMRVGDKISDLEKLGGYIQEYDKNAIRWYPSSDIRQIEGHEIVIEYNDNNIITKIIIRPNQW